TVRRGSRASRRDTPPAARPGSPPRGAPPRPGSDGRAGRSAATPRRSGRGRPARRGAGRATGDRPRGGTGGSVRTEAGTAIPHPRRPSLLRRPIHPPPDAPRGTSPQRSAWLVSWVVRPHRLFGRRRAFRPTGALSRLHLPAQLLQLSGVAQLVP